MCIDNAKQATVGRIVTKQEEEAFKGEVREHAKKVHEELTALAAPSIDGLLRMRARQLRDEAAGLEALADSLPRTLADGAQRTLAGLLSSSLRGGT